MRCVGRRPPIYPFPLASRRNFAHCQFWPGVYPRDNGARIPDGREPEEIEMKSRRRTCLKNLREGRRLPVWMLLAILGAQSGAAWGGPNVWTRLGPEGGSILALAIDPQSPSTVYAGTAGPGTTIYGGTEYGNGVFKSTDGGANWTK